MAKYKFNRRNVESTPTQSLHHGAVIWAVPPSVRKQGHNTVISSLVPQISRLGFDEEMDEFIENTGLSLYIVDAADAGLSLLDVDSFGDFLDIIYATSEVASSPLVLIYCLNTLPLTEIQLSKAIRETMGFRTALVGCKDPYFVYASCKGHFNYIIGSKKIGKHLTDAVRTGNKGLYWLDTIEDLLDENS